MLLVKSDFGDEAANKLLRQDSKTCHVRFPEISSNAMSHASLPFPGWFILYRRFNKTSVPKAFSIFLKQNSKILQSYLNIFKRQNNSWYSWIDESLLILTRCLSMKFTVSGQESVRSLRESLGGLGESRHFLAPTGTVALLYQYHVQYVHNMWITCRSPRRSRRIMSRFVACSSRVEYFGVLWSTLEEMANGVLQMMPLKLTDGVRRHGVLLCKFTECPTGCNGSFNMHGGK